MSRTPLSVQQGPPRIPTITPEEEQAEDVQKYYSSGGGDVLAGPKLNIVLTLAHHPELATAYRQLGRQMVVNSTLPDREKEIAVLRTSYLLKCDYEFNKHARAARHAGVSRDEIEAIKVGPQSPDLSSFDQTLVRAVDQLVQDTTIDDPTWAELAERFDRRQLLDLLFAVGGYTMLAMVIGAVRVEQEPQYS